MIRIPPKRPLRDAVAGRPTKAFATLALDVKDLPIADLCPDGDQPRREFDEGGLDILARSIGAHGLLQPIRVRRYGEKTIIVSGERRWRAAVRAGLETIRAVVVPEDKVGDCLVEQLVENCCREDLKPLDQARAFRVLIEREGWNQSRIAEAVGVHRSTVSRSLALLEMPPGLRDRVASGELSASVATELDRLDDKAEVARLADDAVRWKWTESQARTAARARGAPLAPDEVGASEFVALRNNEGIQTEAREDAPDYLVRCNACGWEKLRSAPGGCPEEHRAGFSYVGPVVEEAAPEHDPDTAFVGREVPGAKARPAPRKSAGTLPMVQGMLPLVYHYADDEADAEVVIEREEGLTPALIVAILTRALREAEREYLKA